MLHGAIAVVNAGQERTLTLRAKEKFPIKRSMFSATSAFLVLIAMFGCGGKSDLTRAKAAKLIQAYDQFRNGRGFDLQIEGDEVRLGLKQGLWIDNPSWRNTSDLWFVLSDKGKTYYSRLVCSYSNDKFGKTGITTQDMPRRVIEVTGLSDGPAELGPAGTVKVAQFTWGVDWDAIPNEVKQFMHAIPNKTATGECALKLYDDGWRADGCRIEEP